MGYPSAIQEFIRESNAIEGIFRDPTPDEIEAHLDFIEIDKVSVAALCAFQAVVAPNKPIRDRIGMNVRVGDHIAPSGGRTIIIELEKIVKIANRKSDPWKTHVRFEILHPFMDGNGRTGRILWAWNMFALGLDAFSLPFLHRFYYQTLSAQR